LLVGYAGVNYLLERKAPGRGKLNAEQVIWHRAWRGQAAVVTSLYAACRAIGQEVPG
jgi:hypothetical protein